MTNGANHNNSSVATELVWNAVASRTTGNCGCFIRIIVRCLFSWSFTAIYVTNSGLVCDRFTCFISRTLFFMDLVGILRNKLVFAILSRANVRWRHTVFVTDDLAHAQCVDVWALWWNLVSCRIILNECFFSKEIRSQTAGPVSCGCIFVLPTLHLLDFLNVKSMLKLIQTR